jgi:hypothetical protein
MGLFGPVLKASGHALVPGYLVPTVFLSEFSLFRALCMLSFVLFAFPSNSFLFFCIPVDATIDRMLGHACHENTSTRQLECMSTMD